MYLCCVESLTDSDQNWIFYEFLKLLKNQVKVPVLLVTRSRY